MEELPKVLMVEDTPTLSMLYQEYLNAELIDLDIAETGAQADELLAVNEYDAILLDLNLPDANGMDILRSLSAQGIGGRVIVMTAYGSNQDVIDATKLGASDFIVKPFNAHRLRVTLRNMLEKRVLRKKVAALEKAHPNLKGFCKFIGSSIPMQAVYRVLEAAAPSKATVFIKGESGTGKDLAADAIHTLSPRAETGEFVALNCAAIPKDLMESEIFGHVKGAFTGAVSNRIGAAQQADGGTLFLDEIGELDLDLQSKLLRFVQSGTFRPVGGSKDIQVNVRIVCATNKDPLKEVAEGRFREDLYYRLHVIPVEMPPLRERGQDILDIAETFLHQYSEEENKSFARFSTDTKQYLLNWQWSGNVRELQNMVHTIIVLNDGEEITSDMLPEKMHETLIQRVYHPDSKTEEQAIRQATQDVTLSSSEFLPSSKDAILPLAELERRIIEHAIDLCEGNIPAAAAFLGVSPSTIYRKKQQWEKELHPFS